MSSHVKEPCSVTVGNTLPGLVILLGFQNNEETEGPGLFILWTYCYGSSVKSK